jgi:hypothetical protein
MGPARRPRRPLVRPSTPRSRRPRRSLIAGTVLALAAPVVVLGTPAPASAAISAPGNGATVSGNVAITEGTGATSNCIISGGSPSSRIAVTRLSDGAVVHTASRSGTGSLGTTWASVGQPRGQYRIQSFARNTVRSGFANLGCSTQNEAQISSYTVTLDNAATVAVQLPGSVVTGETLPVTVRTTLVGAGVTGQVVGGRTVTVEVPGVGTDEVVTGADGTATTSFDLPDLAAGPLTVSATVTPDPTYSGRSGEATTTLSKRTTQTLYRGESRGEPGSNARLEALLVDATPGSDRFGEPVVGEPVALAFGDDTAEVETVASGRAIRTVALTGPSRTVPVAVAYAGDDVRLPSGDGITFFVGDDAAAPAPVQSGPVASTVTGLTGFLTTLLGGLPVQLHTDLPILGDVVGNAGLQNLLDTLLGPVTPALVGTGDQVDAALGTVLDGLESTSPLGNVVAAARFRWRAAYVAPDGTRRNREFDAVVGVPQPLDVTGDGRSDVLANVTLAEIRPDSVVPRLEVARLGDVSAPLPLSLQAVIDLGGDDDYRFGYDTRQGSAPTSFTADVQLGDGGAVLGVAADGDEELTVSGAIVPGGDAGSDAEQRFGVTFSDAPSSAVLGLGLGDGGSQDIAVDLSTDEPTRVDLSLVDDGGAAQVFLADGTLDQVDGDVSMVVSGDETSGLTAELSGEGGLDTVELRARSLDDGRTDSDVRLALSDVPDVVSFGLTADGAGELTASGPIGVFEAGYASGRDLALLDDPAYLRLLQDDETQSIAVRLPGFEGMSVSLAEEMSLALTMAPSPLRALVEQEGRRFDARITDAPHQLSLALSADGSVSVEGSAPIDEVLLEARDDEGILDGSSHLDLRLVDVPRLLTVGVGDDGVVFDTGGEAIGLLEVFADDGTHLAVPGDGDGLLVRSSGEGTALAGRISGLRRIEASLGDAPDVLLDTVAGKVFTITLREEGADDVRATLDHLVPGMRLGLVDDGSGATRLTYSASEATSSLSFDMGGLSGSIGGPLPERLVVCMAGDEACLPDLGIDDPGLGSVRFAASETTTLDLVDPNGGLNAQNLRLQVLDLTGTVDAENGGDVYLNTTEYGDDFGNDCGTAGCVRPIQGGRVTVDLGSAGLLFEPGNGFLAKSALTKLKVRKLFGQPIGLDSDGGTGVLTCVPATRLDVTVYDVPALGDLTLSVKDAICNVDRG